MKKEKDPKKLQEKLLQLGSLQSIGFVPTMGALHEGHLSLIRKARRENSFVVVSLFVNPTQFDDPGDFKSYPRDHEKDLGFLKEEKADLVFCPEKKSLYPDNYLYQVVEQDLSQKLCGKSRPGHFTGVLTVVLKLLNLVRAKRAYFGEKDYQQLKLIQEMVKAFFIPTEIIACPTLRDREGLAFSSRNQRLSPSGLKKAQAFAKALQNCQKKESLEQKLLSLGLEIDFIEDIMGRLFVAVKIENVRLIDNVPL